MIEQAFYFVVGVVVGVFLMHGANTVYDYLIRKHMLNIILTDKELHDAVIYFIKRDK